MMRVGRDFLVSHETNGGWDGVRVACSVAGVVGGTRRMKPDLRAEWTDLALTTLGAVAYALVAWWLWP